MSMKMGMEDFLNAKQRKALAIQEKLRREASAIGTKLAALSKEREKLKNTLVQAAGGDHARRKVAIRFNEVEHEILAMKLEARCIQDQIASNGEYLRYLSACKAAWNKSK